MGDEETSKSKSKVAPPGPGKYDLPSFPTDQPISHVANSAKFSMGKGRPEPLKRSDNADPGKYHPNLATVTARPAAWGFGSSQRAMSGPSKSQQTPGPALGQIDNPLFYKSPRYGFGSAARTHEVDRQEKKSKKPGPGQHNPDITMTSKCKSTPSYSAASRRESLVNSKLPGPGTYTVTDSGTQTWKSSPRYKFGTAGRGVMDKKGPPGPGQYTVAGLTNTGHGTMGDAAPKWSMTGRPTFNIAKDTC